MWRAPGVNKARTGEDLRQRVQTENRLDQVHDIDKEDRQ